MKTPALVRFGAATVCTVRALQPLLGPSSARGGATVAILGAVLGARYSWRAVEIVRGHPGSLRGRVGVEGVHASTMAAAAILMPEYRRPALGALALATAVIAGDVAGATRASA